MKIEKIKVCGFSDAFRGMRNPKKSWDNSDSKIIDEGSFYDIITIDDKNTIKVKREERFEIGPKDMKLAKSLIAGGPDHRKFIRQIIVWFDLTESFDFWKEFDTYKVGTVSDSCSTMHTITSRLIEPEDFNFDGLREKDKEFVEYVVKYYNNILQDESLTELEKTRIMSKLNLLGYEQMRTILCSYENLVKIYFSRKSHKLNDWREFCKIISFLPYFRQLFIDK